MPAPGAIPGTWAAAAGTPHICGVAIRGQAADTCSMSAAKTFHLTSGKLNRLAHSGLDSFAYRERAIRDLRAAFTFDAAWWWTIDPASALFTSGVFEPFPSDHVICGGLHSSACWPR